MVIIITLFHCLNFLIHIIDYWFFPFYSYSIIIINIRIKRSIQIHFFNLHFVVINIQLIFVILMTFWNQGIKYNWTNLFEIWPNSIAFVMIATLNLMVLQLELHSWKQFTGNICKWFLFHLILRFKNWFYWKKVTKLWTISMQMCAELLLG